MEEQDFNQNTEEENVDNINEVNRNIEIQQEEIAEVKNIIDLPESLLVDDESLVSPSNLSDETSAEVTTPSSSELTEVDNLHGIQPEVIIIDDETNKDENETKFEEPKDLSLEAENQTNGIEEVCEDEVVVDSLLKVDQHPVVNGIKSLPPAPQSPQRPRASEARFNPFDKISPSDENNDLLKYQNKTLEEIEKFTESYSPSSSVQSSPEKIPAKKTLNELSSEVWLQQQTTHPDFELIPPSMKQQKPVDNFSSSVEDIEQAVKEVTVHEPVIDDPWVKIEDVRLPREPRLSQSHENHLASHDNHLNSHDTYPGLQHNHLGSHHNRSGSHDNHPGSHDNLPASHEHDLRSHEVQPSHNLQQDIEPTNSARPIYNTPGPCDPNDLIEGIIFTANYLGSTQLQSERNPGKNARMLQAQEAVSRIKAPEGESQPSVEVDLFISTDKVKILNAETQESMMDHTLRSISYIADIGKLLVIMARRKAPKQDKPELMREPKQQHPHRIVCHVFSSEDAHLMAQAIGQAFSVAYQQFLTTNGIEPQSFTRDDYNELLDMQEMYHDDLVHYSKQENVKDVWVEKKKGENMGVVIVESGWGSIVPTVILANMQHGSPVERCGKLSIGDQLMTVNGTSLVGLPIATCQSIIKGLRSQSLAHLHIVSCPPVVTVLIKRPDLKYQLGFSVQDGIICSLMRGGIAERGGVRVGHRIIEINGQSVVATAHERIVQQLVTSLGEIQMKTMPATMYRLLTGQEQPVYI